VVHLVNVLALVPEAIGLVDKHKVFVFVVNHFADIVHIHHLQQDHQRTHIRSVHWADDTSLGRVLQVHVVMVVTVSD
jgi:hypothetical protein